MIREAQAMRRAYAMFKSDSQVETVAAVAILGMVLYPAAKELARNRR
ncbi:hypothetical protein ACFO0N_19645 [Halobium salinum]|uniref:Uncharacterized protein n=1 Tax=Halobium salinum TaxID=1364940 RepID=A0ABD5PI23_9EURY